MAGELAPFGITVNMVLPGFTKTTRLEELSQAQADKRGVKKEDVVEEWIKSTPMGRLGEPEEIAASLKSLCPGDGEGAGGHYNLRSKLMGGGKKVRRSGIKEPRT